MTATANELLKQAVEAHSKVIYSDKPDRTQKDDEATSQKKEKGG